MSAPKKDEAAAIAQEKGAADQQQPLQTDGNGGAESSVSSSTSSSTRQRLPPSPEHLSASEAAPTLQTDSTISSSADATTPKRNRKTRISFSPVHDGPKKRKSTSVEKDEQPSMSKSTRPKRNLSSAARVSTPGKVPGKEPLESTNKLLASMTRKSARVSTPRNGSGNELNDFTKKLLVASMKSKRSAKPDTKGAKRQRGEWNESLEKAMAEAIIVTPYFIDVKLGLDGPTKRSDPPIVPVNVLKSENLPGIVVWDETSYVDNGYSLVKKAGQIEYFTDREVEKVVGYVLNKPNAFVLVKLALKRNEKTIDVKDVVQAVDCAFAARQFPKAFTDFMTRMATTPNQPTAADTEDGDGPSGSGPTTTPSGRPTRGTKK